MKRIALKIVFASFLLWIVPLNAFYAGNESPCAFTGECDQQNGATSSRNSQSLSQLVAIGGTHFLRSLSDIDLILSEVEASGTSGLDFNTLRASLETAVNNITQAESVYMDLQNLADAIPYFQPVIDKLLDFDYNGFRQANGLIQEVFVEVETYLTNGDVRGVYDRFHQNTIDLREHLNRIKGQVDSGTAPHPSDLFQLNQKSSEYKLFGQYVAEVFYAIK